jgi:tRNA(Phe) wybutosine-synthesizing methylase Tyw3
MRIAIISVILVLFSSSVFATQYSVSGKVKMIRLHQYLTNQGWDENVWFCLDSTEVKGDCGTASHCGGRMGLAIDKNTHPEMYSTILAARVSQIPIKVWVEDTFKINGSDLCYARIVDI